MSLTKKMSVPPTNKDKKAKKTKMMHRILNASLLIISLSIQVTVDAEVVLDGTLGPAEKLSGPNFAIEAHLGQQMGNNLFHSFEKFNLNSQQTATFSGPNIIHNIISRVTDGYPSQIDGRLSSTIPNADMYFLNPAGVMLGPNARLDLQGSLYISTADYLRLGDTGEFNATQPENSLLTIAPPAAFGFLNQSPASISKQLGFLVAPDGKTISFVGGDITLQENLVPINEEVASNTFLFAPSGRINLVSVASPGEVPVNPEKMPDNAFEQFGTIKLTDMTPFDYKSPIGNLDVSGASGKIYIRGGQIVVDNGYVFADTLGNQNGQGITINAEDELVLAGGTRLTSQVVDNAEGDAGNITVTAGRITVTDGSQITTSTEGKGAAGNIHVSAKETINISGSLLGVFDSGIASNTAGTGNGGNITVTAPHLNMDENGTIRADTQNFGNIDVAGDAGDISIKVDTLTLTGGAKIAVSAGNQEWTNKTGRGGHLTVNANKSILISGDAGESQPSGLLTNVFTGGEGGTIKVSAPVLEIMDNGTIQSATAGKGNAGHISMKVGTLHIQNNGWITSKSQASGNAGHISMDVGTLHIQNNGWITSESQASGDAGNLSIHSDDILLHNGEIRTQSSQSGGGDINIQASSGIHLVNSTLSAMAQGEHSEHHGGNLTIQRSKIFTLDNSQLLAHAVGGNGGDIRLHTDELTVLGDSRIDVSSQFRLNGELQINDIELREISHQPISYLDAASLLNNRCAGLTKQNASQFVVTIRDVPPPSPEDLRTHYYFP